MLKYWDTKIELDVINERISLLEERRELLWSQVTNTTSKLSQTPGRTLKAPDAKIVSYIQRIDEIEKELGVLYQEKILISNHITKLQNILDGGSGKQSLSMSILKLYYVDGMKPDQIATRCHCDRSTVFRHLKRAREKQGN